MRLCGEGFSKVLGKIVMWYQKQWGHREDKRVPEVLANRMRRNEFGLVPDPAFLPDI
jgi:hypothetical protein